MSIRFKFRSSVTFDSVEIKGRPSISIRDLKSKILDQKNLKICNDFDLLISDATTGLEYDDENFLVPSGSSVIIKRVPAGRSGPPVMPHVDAVGNSGIKQIEPVHNNKSSPRVNVDMENFDDFGIDLYPTLGDSPFDSDVDVDKMNCNNGQIEDNAFPSSSEPSIVRQQHLEPSDLSQAIPRGALPGDIEGTTSQPNLKQKIEDKKLDGVVDANSPTMPKSDIPSELRCSLCNTIFKEAVMIPCCQHSFCEKCIHAVLIEKAKCPKCYSTRCSVGDLLPNVSLRQAIEHFLESQILISGSDNVHPKYAPDGESGIQAKEFSCAMSVRQREPILPHSPSGTGKGSNQVMVEYGKSEKSVPLSHKMKQMRNGERDAVACVNYRRVPEDLDSVAECQGESQPPALPPGLTQKEEANSIMKRKRSSWVDQTDGAGSFAATANYRKGDRSCYKCGSPDHLIRDCPAASGQYPMIQPGYGPPYWHGASYPQASYPQMRPYGNMYASPGMMPFAPTMIPVAPLRVPSYAPPMYGGLSVPCGLMGMGGMVSSMMTGAERPVSQAELMELQDSEQRHKHLYENQNREKLRHGDFDGSDYYYEPHLSHGCNRKLDEGYSESYSGHDDIQRPQKKHQNYKHPEEVQPCIDRRNEKGSAHAVDRRHEKGSAHANDRRNEKGSAPAGDRRNEKGSLSAAGGRDRKAHVLDVSSSEMEDMSDNSDWHDKERHRQHHRKSKKHVESREHYSSDSSRRSRHKSQKETSTGRDRVETDFKRHGWRHHNHSGSGLEPSSSGDQKRLPKEKESGHSSRHSKHKLKSKDDQSSFERWKMVDGLDDNRREEYYSHSKRKRIR